MKWSLTSSIFIAVLFFAKVAYGVEIRIAAVKEPGVPPDSEMLVQMDEIQDAFTASHGNTVTISLVDFGNPLQLTSQIYGGTLVNQVTSARNNNLLNQHRNDNAADLVVAFVSALPFGACGFGYNPLWSTGNGIQPPQGPDLRPKDSYYIALVSTRSHCQNFRWHVYAAHEIAHLMGAGHRYPYFNGLISLKSYGDFIDPDVAVNNLGVATVMSIDPEQHTKCYDSPPNECISLDQFSSSQTQTNPPFSYFFENIDALNTSAPSVALFREPPTCGLSAPILMSGYIEDICYGGNLETRHWVSWVDACPDESDNYRLYAQQPTGGANPYSYFGTVFSPGSYVLVNGTDSNIKAKACEGLSCSNLSLSHYTAQYIECH